MQVTDSRLQLAMSLASSVQTHLMTQTTFARQPGDIYMIHDQ